MRTELIHYLENNTDRFAARWMCCRDPHLWDRIVALTSFLPSDAKPKQRVWHVLNDIWQIPKCPVDGIPVSWFENRYLTYSSLSAKSRCEIVYAKMVDTYKKKTGDKGHWSNNPENRKNILAMRMAKQTNGYVHSDQWHDKIRETWVRKRAELGYDLTAYREYLTLVRNATNRSYRKHKVAMEAHGLIRSRDNHIDHIFSVFEAFKQGIPPEVTGHHSNLRIISGKANARKQTRCDKTLEALWEDYHAAEGSSPAQ